MQVKLSEINEGSYKVDCSEEFLVAIAFSVAKPLSER